MYILKRLNKIIVCLVIIIFLFQNSIFIQCYLFEQVDKIAIIKLRNSVIRFYGKLFQDSFRVSPLGEFRE